MRPKPVKRKRKTKRNAIIAGFLLVISVFVLLMINNESANAPSTTKTNNKKTEQSFNKQRNSTSDPNSIWVVVNKTRPLNPLMYAPADLVPVGNSQLMRQEAATALQTLILSAKTEGLTLVPLSGYRSFTAQQAIYNSEVAGFGQAVADTQSAKPGHSEHQTGFAIDVGGGGCDIEDCFGQTKEGQWVAANAYKYGFVVRYTKGKESSTGYRAEPWHIRYFGKELSAELQKTGQTPEEFFHL